MYTPPDMSRWQGRVDAEEGLLARRWHQCVEAWEGQTAPGIVLLGFACDAGVSRNQGRPGARNGPAALRRALAGFAWHHRGSVYDAGDVNCVGDELEAAQAELGEQIAGLLAAHQFPLILGGGHEMAYGCFTGIAKHAETHAHPPVIGIVNLDAHFDLRTGEIATSGTPFRQIADVCKAKDWPFNYLVYGIAESTNTQALFQTARELGVMWRSDEECVREHLNELLGTLEQFTNKVDWIYLTICLDVLPASVAPGVSAPAVLGIELSIVEAVVDAVKMTGKLKLADIAELNPACNRDGQTAKVAARLAWRLAR